MLELELEGTTMSKLEACEDGRMPAAILVASDLCEEGGPAEVGVLCHGVKLIKLAQGQKN